MDIKLNKRSVQVEYNRNGLPVENAARAEISDKETVVAHYKRGTKTIVFGCAFFVPKGAKMKENRTIVAIGEPSIDVLPKEMLDCFYTTLLTRIAELIHADKAKILETTAIHDKTEVFDTTAIHDKTIVFDTTAAYDKAQTLDTTASHEEVQNELSKV